MKDFCCRTLKLILFSLIAKVEDLATPFLRVEAELRGEGRDCMEPVRRRVNPTTPHRAMKAIRDSPSRFTPFIVRANWRYAVASSPDAFAGGVHR